MQIVCESNTQKEKKIQKKNPKEKIKRKNNFQVAQEKEEMYNSSVSDIY